MKKKLAGYIALVSALCGLFGWTILKPGNLEEIIQEIFSPNPPTQPPIPPPPPTPPGGGIQDQQREQVKKLNDIEFTLHGCYRERNDKFMGMFYEMSKEITCELTIESLIDQNIIIPTFNDYEARKDTKLYDQNGGGRKNPIRCIVGEQERNQEGDLDNLIISYNLFPEAPTDLILTFSFPGINIAILNIVFTSVYYKPPYNEYIRDRNVEFRNIKISIR